MSGVKKVEIGQEFQGLVNPKEVVEVGRSDITGAERPGQRMIDAVRRHQFGHGHDASFHGSPKPGPDRVPAPDSVPAPVLEQEGQVVDLVDSMGEDMADELGIERSKPSDAPDAEVDGGWDREHDRTMESGRDVDSDSRED